jgi:hypothetical protein
MPEGLDIDRKSQLNGVISGYAEQVLVCTGQDDWAPRIEEESGGDNLAADLKELFGRGGTYSDVSICRVRCHAQRAYGQLQEAQQWLHNGSLEANGSFKQPFHNVSVLNSSFPSTQPPRTEVQSTSAYLLPSFKYVPYLPRVSFDAVQALAKAYLLPTKLHAAHEGLSPLHRDQLTREESYAQLLPSVKDVDEVLVLICGHGGRDVRCGVMGPLLRDEFEDKVGKVSSRFEVRKGAVQIPEHSLNGAAPAVEGPHDGESAKTGVRVGLISHIGGHKFAGNVIIYIPPGLRLEDQSPHPLAGYGIWYGRVEPQHVEGIVAETMVKGNVVEDMFRGGIDGQRRILRL